LVWGGEKVKKDRSNKRSRSKKIRDLPEWEKARETTIVSRFQPSSPEKKQGGSEEETLKKKGRVGGNTEEMLQQFLTIETL